MLVRLFGRRRDRWHPPELAGSVPLEDNEQAVLLVLVQIASDTLEGLAARGFALLVVNAAAITAAIAGILALPPPARSPDMIWPLLPLFTAILTSSLHAFALNGAYERDASVDPIQELYRCVGQPTDALRTSVGLILDAVAVNRRHISAAIEEFTYAGIFTFSVFAIVQWLPAVTPSWILATLYPLPPVLYKAIFGIFGMVLVAGRALDLPGTYFGFFKVSMIFVEIAFTANLLGLSFVIWLASAWWISFVDLLVTRHRMLVGMTANGYLLAIPVAVLYFKFARRPGRLTWGRAGVPVFAAVILFLLAVRIIDVLHRT